VVGLTLAKARTRIARAHCRVGKVSRVRSTARKKNRVIRQAPRPGRRLASGGKVNLTLGKGGARS
jgi:beta-lactam-binding protein with PASTA domain